MREWALLEFLAGRIGVTLLRKDLRSDAVDAPTRVVHEVLEGRSTAARGALDLDAVSGYRLWVVTRRNPFSEA